MWSSLGSRVAVWRGLETPGSSQAEISRQAFIVADGEMESATNFRSAFNSLPFIDGFREISYVSNDDVRVATTPSAPSTRVPEALLPFAAGKTEEAQRWPGGYFLRLDGLSRSAPIMMRFASAPA